jgi:hypothetical protein
VSHGAAAPAAAADIVLANGTSAKFGTFVMQRPSRAARRNQTSQRFQRR